MRLVDNLTITIPNYKLPSRNKLYASSHWRSRQKLAKEVHELVMAYSPKKLFKVPVNIRIDAYYKHKHRRDSDNVEAKLLIDGLCGRVIQDDDPRYVHDVTTRSHIGSETNKVVIYVQQAETIG